jgi:hypothetical protein
MSFLFGHEALQHITISALNTRFGSAISSMQIYSGRSNGQQKIRKPTSGNRISNQNSPFGERFPSKKQTPLDQRKGSRPLNPTERKAKEIFDGSRMPEVERVEYNARVPLSALSEGQKVRGRVISVTE